MSQVGDKMKELAEINAANFEAIKNSLIYGRTPDYIPTGTTFEYEVTDPNVPPGPHGELATMTLRRDARTIATTRKAPDGSAYVLLKFMPDGCLFPYEDIALSN